MNNPRDPILDEIQETRRRLLTQHGGVAGLAAFLRKKEAESDRPVVAPSHRPKPTDTSSAADE